MRSSSSSSSSTDRASSLRRDTNREARFAAAEERPRHTPIRAPSAENIFEGWFYDNRSASRVINHRQRIDESSRMRDRSASRVMNIFETGVKLE